MAFRNSTRILLSFLFLTQYLHSFVQGQPQAPCYFVFGDSLADPGNNNNLGTQAKSNFRPYGIDFVNGPTGRFTNNRTQPDIIGQLLGFKDFIPPFANTAGKDITKGVNYASAVSGIRDETGKNQGDRITLNEQLNNHFVTVSRITNIFRSYSAARQHLGRCIYIIITGNNDYINNYFIPNIYLTSRFYSPQQYADVLARQYSEQLEDLYFLGARKVAVFGVGLIGSTPTMISRFGANATAVSDTAQLFSNNLPPLVTRLNSKLPTAKFTYINTTGITITPTASTAQLNLANPCCPIRQDLGTCIPGSTPCPNRAGFAFFDGFHTTDVVNAMFAARAYKKLLPLDATPYDISQLAMLPL